MSKLGALLKETREEKGITFDKVTEDIRLSADIITQLEDGGFSDLPSYNHAKNFVKNYAEYLGLDQDSIQAMLAEECTKSDFTHEPITVATEEPLEQVARSSSPENPSSGSSKFVIPVVLIIIVAVLGGYLLLNQKHKTKPVKEETVSQQQDQQKQEQEDTEFNTVDKKILEETINAVNAQEQSDAPAAEDQTAATSGDAAKTAPDQQAVSPVPGATPDIKAKDAKAENSKLKKATLNFADVCWVHMKADTGEELDFIADKGTHKEVEFENYFILDIGNAAVASVTYNGKVIAGLGGYKQPVKGLKFEPNPVNGALKYSSVK